MGRFAYPILIAFSVLFFAPSAQATIYTCSAETVQRVGGDGTPTPLADGEPWPFARFSFDDRTGRVDGDNETRVLSLLQKAVGPNALLAVGIQKGIGNTALQVLKIDAASASGMPFVWIADNVISTGVCKND